MRFFVTTLLATIGLAAEAPSRHSDHEVKGGKEVRKDAPTADWDEPSGHGVKGGKAVHKDPETTDAEDTVPDWKKYTEGDPGNWTKYLSKPDGVNGGNDTFDWMKYAAPYIGGMGSSNSSSNSSDPSSSWQSFAAPYMGGQTGQGPAQNTSTTQWNNGQGDGFGEPFRSQTGGDFRYKFGRGNGTGGGWEKYAGSFGNVSPQQPGTEGGQSGMGGMGSAGGQSGGFDWQQYAGKYMGGASSNGTTEGGQSGMGGMGSAGGQSGGFDWQQYAGKYMGGADSTAKADSAAKAAPAPSAGGYFELNVTGKDLNVTTNFGLGQGGGGSNETGGGGGGGNQNSITAKEGGIFIRGTFLNRLADGTVVA